ncbi:MAG: serine/threonine-protein phosphatase [Prevotella sp.]|nr:serine/threonine-protein phosphatase [Prevotella sp.]
MELRKLHKSDDDIFIGFAESRIGGRPENQDSYGFMDTEFGFLVTVCDGMGGGPGGKTASNIAVNEILAGVDEASKDEEITNILIKAVRRANMAILEAASQDSALRGMGSTATVLLISEKSAFLVHAGDSRIYQVRGKHKIFRTFDHSMVFDLVKQKVITEEQARLSAQSNVITRALGIKPDLEVDVVERPYEKGDRFILCSDGIHGIMPEKELIRMFGNRKVALGAVVDDIATYVDNMGRDNGGRHDNLTIAIVETKINSKLRQTMSKQVRISLLILAVICLFSIIMNIVQATSDRTSDAVTTSESTLSKMESLKREVKVKQDSIVSLNDTIKKLRNEKNK